MLFKYGDFVGHSGGKLPFKIECDALTDDDLDCLARYYVSNYSPNTFGEVNGVPRGGLRFAEAIRRYVKIEDSITHPNLIVDDVLTTGKSMQAFRREHYPMRGLGVVGVVIFARVPCPTWITPIFVLF